MIGETDIGQGIPYYPCFEKGVVKIVTGGGGNLPAGVGIWRIRYPAFIKLLTALMTVPLDPSVNFERVSRVVRPLSQESLFAVYDLTFSKHSKCSVFIDMRREVG